VLIEEASSVIDEELQQMASALGAAQASTTAYAGVLRTAGAALPTARSGAELSRLATELAAATDRSEAQMRALQQRLESSAGELHRLWAALEKANVEARTDPLTGLWNRKAFDERLAALFKLGGRLSLAIVDVDHFKRVNDRWGHQTGDQVLRFIAAELSRSAPSPRVCIRYGGEEFAILFPGESRGAILESLETMRTSIHERQLRRRSTGELLGQLSVSAGLAERGPADTVATLIARADAALYAAKRGGRNRVVFEAEAGD
jgi:diguanylate cyclase